MSTRTIQHKQGSLLFCLTLCMTMFMSMSVQAAFITDKVVVNIHSEKFEQGTVLKKISSGTPVTVLMNDGEFSRIRTNDNITGWIESKYVTNEKPTQLEYLELLAKTKTLEAKLKAAESNQTDQGSTDAEGVDVAELVELRKRAADAGWMRVELKKARDRVIELETQLNSKNKNTSNSQDELKSLRDDNKMLKERLAAALLVNEQQDVTEPPGDASPVDTTNTDNHDNRQDQNGWSVNISWFLGSIVVALIIGLIVGMTWLDKRIRQRHGGFRIY